MLPTIIIAELGCHPDMRNVSLSPEQQEQRVSITQEFLDSVEQTPFLVCELDVDIAVNAGKIGTRFKLKGADAVIVASALHWDCSHLYTRDQGILKISHSMTTLKIETPPDPPPMLF